MKTAHNPQHVLEVLGHIPAAVIKAAVVAERSTACCKQQSQGANHE